MNTTNTSSSSEVGVDVETSVASLREVKSMISEDPTIKLIFGDNSEIAIPMKIAMYCKGIAEFINSTNENSREFHLGDNVTKNTFDKTKEYLEHYDNILTQKESTIQQEKKKLIDDIMNGTATSEIMVHISTKILGEKIDNILQETNKKLEELKKGNFNKIDLEYASDRAKIVRLDIDEIIKQKIEADKYAQIDIAAKTSQFEMLLMDDKISYGKKIIDEYIQEKLDILHKIVLSSELYPDSSNISKIINYTYSLDEELIKQVNDYDNEFMKSLNDDMLINVSICANFLHIEHLLAICTNTASVRIFGAPDDKFDVDLFRQKFGIRHLKNDDEDKNDHSRWTQEEYDNVVKQSTMITDAS